jgi:two-component system, sensor histidine kinase LadS
VARCSPSLLATLVLWCALGAVARPVAAAPLMLSPDAPSVSVESHWEAFIDEGAALRIEDVRSIDGRFRKMPSHNFSFTDAAVWLRLRVATSGGDAQERILDFARPWVDDVRIYVESRDGRFARLQSRDTAADGSRLLHHERLLARIQLEPGRPTTVYVRMAGRSPLAAHGVLYTPDEFTRVDHRERIWFGVYFGVLLFMAAYNLLLFASLRDREHLLLGLLLGLWAFGEIAAHGYLGHDLPGQSTTFLIASTSFAVAAIILAAFTREFLDTRSLASWIDRWFRRLLFVIAALASVAVIHPPAARWLWWAFVAITLAIIAITGHTLARGRRESRHFAIALLPFMSTALIPLAEVQGAAELQPFTEHAVHVGLLIMATALSLALADKIHRLHRGAARFVPRDFIARLGRRSIADVRLGDHTETQMTVLFSDIRSFTSRAETMPADGVFHFLNRLFGSVVPAVLRHGGFIDKYIGDAIMALFPEEPDRALDAAIDMQRAIDRFNAEHREMDGVQMGVGLHHGPLMLGTIGDAERLEATVIADAVNLCSRLEGLTKEWGARVIVSNETVVRLRDRTRYAFRRLGSTRVKGRVGEIVVHELLDAEPAPIRDARKATCARFEAAVDHIAACRLAEAAAALAEVLEADAGDEPARYLAGCVQERSHRR